jgi:glycerol-3-phosphate dehydrogenase
VFNAAGVWVDAIRKLADPQLAPVTTVSQGSHIVLDREFLPASAALLIPRTRDGRVLFVVPWYGVLLVGTTDVARPDAPLEPQPTVDEIGFLLKTAGEYLQRQPAAQDIRARFSGLRPLFSPKGMSGTAQISREHAVLIECGNLVSVVGGKWTTYRRMAEDALDAARGVGLRGRDVPAGTDEIRLVSTVFASHSATDFRTHLAATAFHAWADEFTQARTEHDVRARRVRLDLIEQ